MDSTWIIHASVAVAVPLAFVLFRRLVPYRLPASLPAEELERLKKQYAWVDWAALLPMLLFLCISTVVWAALFATLARLRDSLMPPALLLVTPQPWWVFWLLPGFFLGLISAGWLTFLTIRLLIGPRGYAEYQVVSKGQVGFDLERVWKWITLAIVAGATGWCVLALDWYARFEEERIVVNPLFGFGEKVYRYDQVDQIVETSHLIAPNGNLVQRTRYFVVFDDHRQWEEDRLLGDPQATFDLMTRKTGKPVVRARFLEDVVKP
jgi:hypothetical protein